MINVVVTRDLCHIEWTGYDVGAITTFVWTTHDGVSHDRIHAPHVSTPALIFSKPQIVGM